MIISDKNSVVIFQDVNEYHMTSLLFGTCFKRSLEIYLSSKKKKMYNCRIVQIGKMVKPENIGLSMTYPE